MQDNVCSVNNNSIRIIQIKKLIYPRSCTEGKVDLYIQKLEAIKLEHQFSSKFLETQVMFNQQQK
eukprot:Pgem_evm1s19339